jgi:hypothetical protein
MAQRQRNSFFPLSEPAFDLDQLYHGPNLYMWMNTKCSDVVFGALRSGRLEPTCKIIRLLPRCY